MTAPITIAMVLKTRGDYQTDDVSRLTRGILRNLPEYPRPTVVCFTDDQQGVERLGLPVRAVPLVKGWPGWWSKLELFRRIGPVLYFDLDTVITGSLTSLVEAVVNLPSDEFMMLRGFYRADQCSGVMGWSGDFSWLQDTFEKDPGRSGCRGDQDWIRAELGRRKIVVRLAQDLAPDRICSYKRHVLQERGSVVRHATTDHGPPRGTSVVCFHGKPRPRDVHPRPKWMEEHWN